MPDWTALAAEFAPISLAEINQFAALQTRADNKYFLHRSTFAAFLRALRPAYVALEVDGRRRFTYITQYFDTPALRNYWDHVQGRRKRFKCRSRRYLDSGLCVFELKLKGGRGETIKHKMAYSEADSGVITDAAAAFLAERLTAAYGAAPAGPLAPALRNRYERLTLAARGSAERVTCDFNLAFATGGGWQGQMDPDYVLVETKSERGRGPSDLILWGLGARPTSAGSKYCLGMSLLQPALRDNPFQRVRRRYFIRDPQLSALERRPAAVEQPPAAADPPPAHSSPHPIAPQAGAALFAE